MKTKLHKDSKAQVSTHDNVEYTLRDKDGKQKLLFQENGLFRLLLKLGLVNPHTPKLPIFGKWTNVKTVHNLITSAGKAGAASRINGSGAEAAFVYIAVGTGTTAADVADTTLETEITGSGLDRVSATASRVTTTVTNDTAQLTTTFSVSGTKAVTESGVLNAASTGTLLCRQTFSAINVVSGDSLTITWKVKAS